MTALADLVLPPGAVPDGLYRWTVATRPDSIVGAATLLMGQGMRLALVSGRHGEAGLRIVYLFTSGPPDRRVELHVDLDPAHPEIPTLAGVSFQASRFERELADLLGVVPLDHPQPRRLVLHQHWPQGWHPYRNDAGPMPEVPTTVEPYPFVPVKGTGVYEIPVGPVHAGLIEPGHFRFWVVGETILRMKARLWFLHKGIERLFEGRAIADGMELAEKISGDTAVGHGVAYCLAVEEATRTVVAPGAQVIRSILLELERFVNHVSDMGALGNDAGFGLANAWALDLREFMLGLNREITGHRLLRGGVVLGGARVQRLPTGHELEEARERFEEIVDLVSGRSFVIERFTGTAILSGANAQDLGVIGPAGRASGLAFDARVAHPFCDFGTDLTQCVGSGGDVLARYQLRVAEARAALNLVETLINRVGELEVIDELGSAHGSGVGIVEAWRGAAVHRVELAGDGRLARVKIVDPSFLNWPAVPVSLANTIVPDFPLANKSFNLSYAGNDL